MLSWIFRIFDLFFPPFCLECKKEGSVLCEHCLETIVISHHSQKIEDIHITSFFEYKKNTLFAKAIKKAKYYHTQKVFEIITQKIIEKIPEELKNKLFLLVPVPMHFLRKNFRGYNQSEIIAHVLAQNIPHWHTFLLVKRVKNTLQQARLKKDERIKNISNAFALSKKQTFDTKTPILIIDDIVTTGSTIKSMVKELNTAGFYNVQALTLGSANTNHILRKV